MAPEGGLGGLTMSMLEPSGDVRVIGQGQHFFHHFADAHHHNESDGNKFLNQVWTFSFNSRVFTKLFKYSFCNYSHFYIIPQFYSLSM